MFPNRKRKTFTPALLRLLGRWPAWPVGFVRPQNTALSRIKLQTTAIQGYTTTEIQKYRTTQHRFTLVSNYLPTT